MSVRDLMSAAAASAAQRDNDDDPKVGRPTNTFKVVIATDSDPLHVASFSRVAHALDWARPVCGACPRGPLLSLGLNRLVKVENIRSIN